MRVRREGRGRRRARGGELHVDQRRPHSGGRRLQRPGPEPLPGAPGELHHVAGRGSRRHRTLHVREHFVSSRWYRVPMPRHDRVHGGSGLRKRKMHGRVLAGADAMRWQRGPDLLSGRHVERARAVQQLHVQRWSMPGAGVCQGACSQGETQCSGNGIQACESGMWGTPAPCDSATCTTMGNSGTRSASCVGQCAPGQTQCSGNTPQTCGAGGQWVSGAVCANVCSAGSCTGMCAPNSTQCSGATPQTCNSAGQWASGSACTYVCSSGTCTGVCAPGSKQCSGNTPQSCDSGGQWQNGSACPYLCSQGSCTGVCSPGAVRCTSSVSASNFTTCYFRFWFLLCGDRRRRNLSRFPLSTDMHRHGSVGTRDGL
jgi:hypothetical protein